MQQDEITKNGKKTTVYIINSTDDVKLEKDINLYRDVHATVEILNNAEMENKKDAWNYKANDAYKIRLKNLSAKLLHKIKYNKRKILYYSNQETKEYIDIKNGIVNSYNNYIYQNRKNWRSLKNSQITSEEYTEKYNSLQKRINKYTKKHSIFINSEQMNGKNGFSLVDNELLFKLADLKNCGSELEISNAQTIFKYSKSEEENNELNAILSVAMKFNEDNYFLEYCKKQKENYLLYLTINYKMPYSKFNRKGYYRSKYKGTYEKPTKKERDLYRHRWAYEYLLDKNAKHKKQIRKNFTSVDDKGIHLSKNVVITEPNKEPMIVNAKIGDIVPLYIQINSEKISILEQDYTNLSISKDFILNNGSCNYFYKMLVSISKRKPIIENWEKYVKRCPISEFTNEKTAKGTQYEVLPSTKYNIWEALFNYRPTESSFNKIKKHYEIKPGTEVLYYPYYLNFKFILEDSHGRKINTSSPLKKFYFIRKDYIKEEKIVE